MIYRLTTAILIPVWVAMDCVTEYQEFYPQQPGKFSVSTRYGLFDNLYCAVI